MEGLRYLSDVVTLQLDPDRCTGCRMCLAVCPRGVFAVGDGKAQIVDRDACIECGACALNCAPGAVSVDAGVGCAVAIIKGWLTGGEPRCGCSGAEDQPATADPGCGCSGAEDQPVSVSGPASERDEMGVM